MLVDLLSKDNYGSYNISIANLVGLDCAVYLSALINVYFKANNKDKLDTEGFFKVDRNYIKNITTFTKSTQEELDNKLKKISVLTFKSKHDFIKIDLEIITSLLLSDNENLLKEIKTTTKSAKTKEDKIKEELRKHITTDNSELRDAYSAWIDAVIAKQGWMSTKSVELGQLSVDKYSNRNLDVALSLLNIAAINGYRDIEWAINKYEESKISTNFRKNTKPPIKSVVLSEEVF